jgi:phenylacetate-CoA ligase
MIWNPKAECMSGDEMRALQSERLRAAVALAGKVPAYAAKMKSAGIDSISGIDDLSRLPFTLKSDLRENYPFGMFAVPMEKIVRLHASSGTTGKQTVVGHTQNDLDIWKECMARCLTMAGLTKNDVLHVSYGYGLFTGGLGSHYGGEAIGAVTIPVSAGKTALQLQIMTDFGSTALLCTPSYAMLLGDAVQKQSLKIKLKAGIFGAEPWTEGMRKEIEARLGLSAYDIYGLSEMSGPGVACECEYKNGLHIQEDHFIPEIIDPDTLQCLPDGESGELVFTCISREAMPLIRYRTRDITSLRRKKCGCGRTLVKMGKPAGRTDDMLIIRGVNVFPSQIEAVLLSIEGVSPHYQIVVDREGSLDRFEVQVELSERWVSDEVRKIEGLKTRIQREMESMLGVSPAIMLVSPNTIARSEGKAVRVVDKRKL